MPLSHTSTVFNVDQCKIYALTADVTTAPTYGTGIAVPTIKSIELDPDTLSKELYGDTKVVARGSKIRQLMATVNYGSLGLDVLNVLTGGTTTDAGTTPNQTSTFNILGASFPGYFKIEFRILQVDFVAGSTTSSLNVTLWKCKATDSKPGVAAAEDFALQSFSLAAIPAISNDKIITIVENETQAALS